MVRTVGDGGVRLVDRLDVEVLHWTEQQLPTTFTQNLSVLAYLKQVLCRCNQGKMSNWIRESPKSSD